MKPGILLLADGTCFEGEGLGPDASALGEAVFYTGMTGYEEALTDPSYAGHLLTFTYPLIGNYGISGTAAQHKHACVSGAIIKQIARRPSHHESKNDLPSWLIEQGVPALTGVDTRSVTIAIREHGAIHAILAVGEQAIASAEKDLAKSVREATTVGLVASVATQTVETYPGAGPHVIVIDCGVKRAIIRELTRLGARLTVMPYDTPAQDILDRKPDALLVSPGPGDPTDLPQTIEMLRELLGKLPIYGICLGHQLLALACGARTYKLPYGHRGGNQPVKNLLSGSVLVTAQNHGYAVDGASLPADLEATMVNLNDGTNEGFRHRRLPIETLQFHPEASPGPSDAAAFFSRWLTAIA
ncbi:MAG TPA: glutamine-hydrolyzing carbamoyl-phosphate synthase small subunit [Candidatus Baltobacteraceae bacterium]|jgi:carbamoyl-phosphate synthase small subunit|nr:glutamine-hydrolyzing carbamoyl-phosphate synthase small subunit [Candidatus Baltobacteraceae bacterium]